MKTFIPLQTSVLLCKIGVQVGLLFYGHVFLMFRRAVVTRLSGRMLHARGLSIHVDYIY